MKSKKWIAIVVTLLIITNANHALRARSFQRCTGYGSLTSLQGDDVYDDLVLAAQCIVSDPTQIPRLCAWLKGSGKVTFANRQGGFYNARIVNQISFEKILRGNPHRSFAVNFRCKPFWNAEGISPITLTESGSVIVNTGSVFSEPVITVYGSGEITLMVETTIVELTGITDSITLDTTLMEAYLGIWSMNGSMSGDFPVLKPGMNAICWSGNVASESFSQIGGICKARQRHEIIHRKGYNSPEG